MEPIQFSYRFKLHDEGEKTFEVSLNPKTLDIISHHYHTPDWAKLSFRQCENCPLDPAKTLYCPIAANIAGLVHAFGDTLSVEKADITVHTPERTCVKKTTVQEGLFSLLGIYMTASGCPVMDRLKPMVRFHLPFATMDETIYRVVTMYLSAQFYRMRRGFSADWAFVKLTEMYQEIKKVNLGVLNRIKGAAKKESLLNAVVTLDAFASIFQSLSAKSVNSIEYLFVPYLKEK